MKPRHYAQHSTRDAPKHTSRRIEGFAERTQKVCHYHDKQSDFACMLCGDSAPQLQATYPCHAYIWLSAVLGAAHMHCTQLKLLRQCKYKIWSRGSSCGRQQLCRSGYERWRSMPAIEPARCSSPAGWECKLVTMANISCQYLALDDIDHPF